MIASAFEAQGFQETLKYHCLGFLLFPLPFRIQLSSYELASYVPHCFLYDKWTVCAMIDKKLCKTGIKG